MGDSKKKTPAEEILESMLKDMGELDLADLTSAGQSSVEDDSVTNSNIEGLVFKDDDSGFVLGSDENYESAFKTEFELTRKADEPEIEGLKDELTGAFKLSLDNSDDNSSESVFSNVETIQSKLPELPEISKAVEVPILVENRNLDAEIKTEIIKQDIEEQPKPVVTPVTSQVENQTPPIMNTDFDKTVAVAGYQIRSEPNYEDRVKISVGQNRSSTGYQVWGGSGSTDSNLAQAGNLQLAQDKIVELEAENEKLRQQNEELMAASEIIKERADLLSAQIIEYKNDREGLEDSFNNEIVLLKSHLTKKDAELRRAQFKIEELDSRLKFDMKKVRIRERELENRLELIRAEKNAIVRNKDEQILDLRRKMDVLQMEVDSYRQKCVELNKVIESSQDSFKRTTRALRLAMANLELQEENKSPLKKVD